MGVTAPFAVAQAQTAPAEGSAQNGLREGDKLLGDLGGLRTRLGARGIEFNLQETSEILGNVTGGVRRGAVYEGATLMGLTIDADKTIGLAGSTINVSAYQIHGRGLTASNLNNLNVASGIEAPRATRLFELWYEQSLLHDALSVRLGQQAADQEFMVSQYGALFINSGFGWATLPALDLPSGGPAYPLATPGVRVKVSPSDPWSVLTGVYSGDPDDNGSGTSFSLNKGVFVISELQYQINAGEKATGRPGTYKFGGWYNSNKFADQRFGSDGLTLADPASNGDPEFHKNNWSLYAMADQMVHRVEGSKDQGLGVFGRIMGAPGDRNAVDVFVNGGVTYKGLVAARPDDSIGLGIMYARVSDRARGSDMDTAFFAGAARPFRRGETVIELTYQAQVTPWWIVQPDFQYVFDPGGKTGLPDNPVQEISDAAVFGLRTTITF